MKFAPALGFLIMFVVAGTLTRFTNQKTGGGDILYADIQHGHKTMGNVVFSHDFHTRVPELTCVDCHSSLFQMNQTNFTVIKERKERVHSYFDKDQYCGYCHNNSTAFNTDNCNLCHEKAQVSH